MFDPALYVCVCVFVCLCTFGMHMSFHFTCSHVCVYVFAGSVPGMRPAEAGEFTRRAFQAGKLGLTEAGQEERVS